MAPKGGGKVHPKGAGTGASEGGGASGKKGGGAGGKAKSKGKGDKHLTAEEKMENRMAKMGDLQMNMKTVTKNREKKRKRKRKGKNSLSRMWERMFGKEEEIVLNRCVWGWGGRERERLPPSDPFPPFPPLSSTSSLAGRPARWSPR
jgi:hypothetical protein